MLGGPDIWYVYVINGCSCVSDCRGSAWMCCVLYANFGHKTKNKNRRCSTPSNGRSRAYKQKMQKTQNWAEHKERKHNCAGLAWNGDENCQTMNSRRCRRRWARGNMKRTKVYIFNLKGTSFEWFIVPSNRSQWDSVMKFNVSVPSVYITRASNRTRMRARSIPIDSCFAYTHNWCCCAMWANRPSSSTASVPRRESTL